MSRQSRGMPEMLDFDTWQALVQLQADYASAIDNAEWERWPGFFTDPCIYRLQPRENHARGLPLATLSFESVGMLKDRAYGIRETLFHDPYYQRHVLSPPHILAIEGEGEGAGAAWRLRCETHYAVFRTKPDRLLDPPTLAPPQAPLRRSADQGASRKRSRWAIAHSPITVSARSTAGVPMTKGLAAAPLLRNKSSFLTVPS